MDNKLVVFFLSLLTLLSCQAAPSKISFTVLRNCANYLCPNQVKACGDSCSTTLSDCEAKNRYNSSWANWVSCAANDTGAKNVLQCRYAFLCRLSYTQASGVTNMRNYLKDDRVSKAVDKLTKVPEILKSSQKYKLNAECIATTCMNDAIYCALNNNCYLYFLFSEAVSSTDELLDYTFLQMSVSNYYLAKLTYCWYETCMD